MNQLKLLFCFSFLLGVSFAVRSQVLIETESFDKRGGWVSDHQAFEKIRSAYLMAHGLGRPVEDAETTVEFKTPGQYHVYVSTYNWTSPWYDGEGPGAFRVLVNGEALPARLGVTGDKWEWQYAGAVAVKHKAKVTLRDLTGFNGRVDAIYFSPVREAPTADYGEMEDLRRQLLGFSDPTAAPKVDLVVVGGGIAGCATALTAARYGLKVTIVDNLPWLGGSNALGVRASGLMFKNLYPELGNITCQLIGLQVSEKNNPQAYSVQKNNGIGDAKFEYYEQRLTKPIDDGRGSDLTEARKRLTEAELQAAGQNEKAQHVNEYRRRNASLERERLLREAGVDIYLNIHVFDVSVAGGKVSSVRGRSLKTGEEFIFSGTMFADCTGDGVVGYLAGADYLAGRESKAYANEPSAPEVEDRKMMGSSMHWYAYPRADPGTFPTLKELPWAMQVSDDYHIDRPQWAWWWETGLEIDNALEAELVRDNFLRAVFGNWAYLKNNVAKYKKFRLDYLQHIAMKRESRRLLGDVILNENDVSGKVKYPDASFTTTWTMDLHYAKPDNARLFPGWEWITYCTNQDPAAFVDRYDVPYRCLYSRNIDNLFVGGRCMSVTHQALGTVRVQTTLGMAGEVIGMAAKICRDNESMPRDVYKNHLDKLISCMKEGAPLK